MEFAVLGPLEVRIDQAPVKLGGPRPRAVLGTLLAHAGRAVSAEHLIDQVWGEDPPPTAVAALQVHVSALRKVLGERLVTTAAGYQLTAAPDEVDASRFTALVAAARQQLTERPARAALDLAAALALWRGEPYDGVPAGSDVASARLELAELRLAALEDRLTVELDLGQHVRAVPELARLVADHPERVRLARLHLLALYRCGRIGDALAAYQDLAGRLDREFGLAPAAELTALVAAIERQDPTLDTPTTIPVPPSRFIGRRRELDQLAEQLGRARLLTVTGPGGSGKTRLALELARDTALDHPDGVHVLELAGLPPGDALVERLATAVSVRARPGTPLVDTLAAHLRNWRALLLFDNCEHLLDDCAALAGQLLARCAGLRVLATSREPLGVAGERVWPLAGLATPAETDPPTAVASSEAVRLLAHRGAAAQPGFTVAGRNLAVAARLCRLLDGLPLAIELAAAQLRTQPLADLTAELDRRLGHGLRLADRRARDTPDRHRTLHAAIDWSYRTLSAEERAVFDQLAVFAGGFTPAAADAVLGRDTREVLARLVDRSVLAVDHVDHGGPGVRYRMLELIRQYAADRLAASDDPAGPRHRHAAWCAELARDTAQFGGAEHRDLVRRLDAEEANLRAALDWCLGAGADPVRALEIASPLWWYWWSRGLMSEGRDWLGRALAAADPTPTPLRGSALRAAAALTRNSGDYPAARVLGEECLAVYRSLADTTGLISALGGLCVTALAQHDFAAALRYGQDSDELARRSGDQLRHASALNNIGLAQRCLDQLDEATAAFIEALAVWRAVGDRRGEAATLGNLGMVRRRTGDLAAARALHLDSLARYRELDLVEGVLDNLEALAGLAVTAGQAEAGLRLLTVAERERARLNAPGFIQDEVAALKAAVAEAHAALGDRAAAVVAAARALPLETAVAEAVATAAGGCG
jgi:predicted ATPase/DNA-binding SARP family transcriptional activator